MSRFTYYNNILGYKTIEYKRTDNGGSFHRPSDGYDLFKEIK